MPLIVELLEEGFTSWLELQAVLSFVRGGEKDWAGFSQALHQVFPEEENDLQTRDCQRELALLLKVCIISPYYNSGATMQGLCF